MSAVTDYVDVSAVTDTLLQCFESFFFFLFQEENVKSCLPFEYTADDYAKKDVE